MYTASCNRQGVEGFMTVNPALALERHTVDMRGKTGVVAGSPLFAKLSGRSTPLLSAMDRHLTGTYTRAQIEIMYKYIIYVDNRPHIWSLAASHTRVSNVSSYCLLFQTRILVMRRIANMKRSIYRRTYCYYKSSI